MHDAVAGEVLWGVVALAAVRRPLPPLREFMRRGKAAKAAPDEPK